MKPALADNLVEFLSFSGPGESIPMLERVSHRDWERALVWLDDTGFALYFLQTLRDTNSADVIPAAILSRLGSNFQGEPRPR